MEGEDVLDLKRKCSGGSISNDIQTLCILCVHATKALLRNFRNYLRTLECFVQYNHKIFL